MAERVRAADKGCHGRPDVTESGEEALGKRWRLALMPTHLLLANRLDMAESLKSARGSLRMYTRQWTTGQERKPSRATIPIFPGQNQRGPQVKFAPAIASRRLES